MSDWTRLFPGRLEYEATELEAIGFQLDERAFQSTGRVVFRGEIDWRGQRRRLEVLYPEAFPFFRPEIRAHNLKLERHHNPYEGNLCLLDRSSRAWNTTDTAAWLVSERVPYLLELLEGDDERMAREETPQGEPMSLYFVPERGTVVFIPEPMLALPADVSTGTATIALGENELLDQRLRGCMTRVCTAGRKKKEQQLAALKGPLVRRFSKPALTLRWVRLPELPLDGNTAAHLLAAAEQVHGFQEPTWIGVGGRVEMSVVGVVVQEEVRQGQYADTWLFAVQLRGGAYADVTSYTVRGHRFAPSDLSERIPALDGLAGKTVALVGLGALGGPLALELARAQVGELRIMDDDAVDAGTIVRWPRGVSAVGHGKSDVLAGDISADYPYTKARRFDFRIGMVAPPGLKQQKTELEYLDDFLDGVHVLIDATAETGVQQFLASLADARRLPQIYLWATEGGWGGAVARVFPGVTGCWYCLQMHLDGVDGIPVPPHDETGRVQPRGCDNPTFTASSFDALPIVTQAMRIISATLLRPRPAEPTYDVFICSQQPDGDAIVAPAWTRYPLPAAPGCPLCHPATT